MGRSRYHFLPHHPHFITCTIINWLPLFSDPALAQIILDSLKFLQDRQRLTLHGYVIMENHLHLLASAADLSAQIAAFKSFTARSLIDHLKQRNQNTWLTQLSTGKRLHKTTQTYQLWQEGSHPQAIFNEVTFHQKLDYIHHNPVRRGYVDEPAHWRYSSSRNYLGMPGILAVEALS
jgi:REP element-mobilizing transposase RayT